MTTPAPTLPLRLFAATALFVGCAAALAPADVVILKDGFVIQGTIRKEMTTVFDKASGNDISVAKMNGFDMIDEGPRVIIFSSSFKQLGAINKGVKIRPEYKSYPNPILARKSDYKLPAFGGAGNPPDFNAKWQRTLKVNVPGGFELIDQQVTYLDPYSCFISSPTHYWAQTYRTSEMDPNKVRKLLYTHPQLAEPDGKPDPLKRIAIARFLKDVGWLQFAKEEVARLKKDIPGPLAKDAQEQFDKFQKELDVATAEFVATEAELALTAGRYQYASELLGAFPDKTADPNDVDRATKLMAQLKTAKEQYDSGRRLLRAVIDEVTGADRLRAAIAAGGGPIVAVWPAKPVADTKWLFLAAAAERVYAELHPDSAGRIESFLSLATQAERQKMQGQPVTKSSAELLAAAVSGWAKGKNGATPEIDLALRIWDAREAVLLFQRAGDRNARNDILTRYKKAKPMSVEELTQVISLLPPAQAEDLAARSGTLLPERQAPAGTYRRKTGSTFDHPGGMEYLIKLPPEYHHGRAYPVLIAMSHPGMDPEDMLRALAKEAERNGYILVAPEWTNQFGKGWEWKGEDHDWVTGVLRDVVRHFTVDNDRVFLFGIGDGANAAMDIGMSHPDLFAGVLAMGPTPKWQGMFLHYWPNAQKLPFYVVTGQLAGTSFANLQLLFREWMPKGFPALMAVYKGRGIEWYSAETPVMFDWMGRKRRPNPKATLNLGATFYEWQIMREGDNRFFWLGADKVNPKNLASNVNPGQTVVPAGLRGDIRGNNLIDVRSRGVRMVTMWLNRDMIDWTQPVRVQLNGEVPPGWRPKVLEPSLDVLLEDYWERGDRRMQFLYKLEFPSGN